MYIHVVVEKWLKSDFSMILHNVKMSNDLLVYNVEMSNDLLVCCMHYQATARGEEGMTLFFVCCNPNCGTRWRE